MSASHSRVPGSKLYIEILRRDPCVYCGKVMQYMPKEKRTSRNSMSIDHIIPRANLEKGQNHWMNFAPACHRCNNGKNTLPMLLYLMMRQGLPNRMTPADILDYRKAHRDHFEHEFNLLPDRWYDPLHLLLEDPSAILG